MAGRLLKCAGLIALLAPLSACAQNLQGWPDPIGWVETYPRMCLPGFHGAPDSDGGYHCAPNAN